MAIGPAVHGYSLEFRVSVRVQLEDTLLPTESVLEHVVDYHRDVDVHWNVGVLMNRLMDRTISFLPKFRNLHVFRSLLLKY